MRARDEAGGFGLAMARDRRRARTGVVIWIGVRAPACLLLLALPAVALPPLSPGFQRMRELRRGMDERIVALREQEAFAAKPRVERMLLTYWRKAPFEGEEVDARDVIEACFGWEEAKRENPTEAAARVLRLLPLMLGERCGGPNLDRKERRQASVPLLKALDDDAEAIREAAIASLRKMYDPPRIDRYHPAMSARERSSQIKAWKRAVLQQNR